MVMLAADQFKLPKKHYNIQPITICYVIKTNSQSCYVTLPADTGPRTDLEEAQLPIYMAKKSREKSTWRESGFSDPLNNYKITGFSFTMTFQISAYLVHSKHGLVHLNALTVEM